MSFELKACSTLEELRAANTPMLHYFGVAPFFETDRPSGSYMFIMVPIVPLVCYAKTVSAVDNLHIGNQCEALLRVRRVRP